ncbi:EAL domain-containing protein [Candidatus Magnetominusculus dajiuhuensis]|uniref:EAL domain-containing protein n=1 Tax=Candidatus Magnetominusculus dajiuhuensis TaxID=3137712 RepID=UPI003B43BF97
MSLSRKINILLFLVTLVGIFELAAIYYYQSLQKYDAKVINLAGRQRMLCQMAEKYALSAAYEDFSDKENLVKTVTEYEQNLNTLYKGGVISGTKFPPAPKRTIALFQENTSLLESFKDSAYDIDTQDAGLKVKLHEKSTALLDISNRITNEFASVSEDKNKYLRGVLIFMTVVGVLIFAIGSRKVYKLMSPLRTLAVSVSKVGKGDYTQKIALPESDDEISDLAYAFNNMAYNLRTTVVSKDYLNGVVDAMGDMLLVIDLNGKIKTNNRAVSGILMFDSYELIGTQASDLFVVGDVIKEKLKEVRAHGPSGRIDRIEGWLKTKNGRKVAVQCSFSMMRGAENGDIICVAIDITQRKHYEEDLRKLSIAVEQSLSAIVITDAKGNIEFVNHKFTENTGYTMSEVKGKNPRIMKSGKHGPEFYKLLWDTITAGDEFRADVCNKKKDGTIYWQFLSIAPIKDTVGNITHFISVQIDDTERKLAEERLKQLAHFDVLTGLPNRFLYKDRLEQNILQAKRAEFNFAIMFLDLDKFKFVNDTLGHHVGDLLLKEVAARLRESVRESDTVARMGGDEFQVLLTKINKPTDAAVIAEKILKAMNEPFILSEQRCNIGVSIGISIFPDNGENIEQLTKNADMAMYHVKERGKNWFKFYDSAMDAAILEKANLERALNMALNRNEFTLHYQPQINIKTGQMVGCEALIRWQHPEMGHISPDRFIPLAEETNLIVPIGEWVLREACNQSRIWRQNGFPAQRIGVNLSTYQFKDPMLVKKITTILEETAMDPRYLDLEITETGLMQNIEIGIAAMKELRSLGVSISVDDFGTGYSSLIYLKRFPIDILKIDQNFIRNCTTDASDAVITSTIISMAHSLNLGVIAEGVETIAQLELLRIFDCDEVQGYIFNRPIPEEEFSKLLEEEHVFTLID